MARYRDRCEHTFVEIPTPAERLRALKESCAPSDIDRERQLEATSLYLFSLSSGTVTLNSLNLNDSLANALGQTIFLSHASLPKNNRTAMPPMNYYFFFFDEDEHESSRPRHRSFIGVKCPQNRRTTPKPDATLFLPE